MVDEGTDEKMHLRCCVHHHHVGGVRVGGDVGKFMETEIGSHAHCDQKDAFTSGPICLH